MAARNYRLFNVELAYKQVLSPSMLRCVFRGDDVRQMKMDAPDQRIKLLLPSLSGKPAAVVEPEESNWWETLCALPAAERPILRTYTLRHVDAEAGELHVEFVMHGTEGPASAWALNAEPGDGLQIAAPNREFIADSGGYEWDPHPQVKQALVVADETALPAAKGILERLATWENPPQLQMFIEVPARGDCLDFSHYPFADVHWLARDATNTGHGEALLNAVCERVRLPACGLTGEAVREEAEGELLWDRAGHDDLCFHGWVAAESGTVRHLRRYLIGECGLSQSSVSFMAYWSRGPRRAG